MSRELSLLRDDFESKVRRVIRVVQVEDGFTMRPFFTRRSPWEQARLWRQSRGTKEIHEAVKRLEREGAPFLAKVLLEVGGQHGRWATNALPGQSWHQWGEAVDCFALVEGRAVWSRRHPAYKAYAERAVNEGLHAGYYWRRPDAVHLQLGSGSVRGRWSWPEIDAIMRYFGEEEDSAAWNAD